jgi:hypothetical protein
MKPSRHFIGRRPSVNVDFRNKIVKLARFFDAGLPTVSCARRLFMLQFLKTADAAFE